jgi:DNA (cytosine-5)-methyltransferase 1
MAAYYNEIDKYAAAWLRNLIAAGHIAPGDVDERSIADVDPDDLKGYTQCHFFAGVGGWSYALRLAGWPDDRPIWTGSCPCQPFSAAGAGKGVNDERHLWPAFRWLIAKRRPAIIGGEQVASAAGRGWLAGVRADLEAMGYAVGAADLCAAGVGAPHIRQRLVWLADTGCTGDERERGPEEARGTAGGAEGEARQRQWRGVDAGHNGAARGMGDAEGEQRNTVAIGEDSSIRTHEPNGVASTDGPWSDFDIIPCDERDFGRGWVARRIEPGSFPLAHGVSGRVAIRRPHGQAGAAGPQETEEHWYNRAAALKGFGNAIVPQMVAEFIRAAITDN